MCHTRGADRRKRRPHSPTSRSRFATARKPRMRVATPSGHRHDAANSIGGNRGARRGVLVQSRRVLVRTPPRCESARRRCTSPWTFEERADPADIRLMGAAAKRPLGCISSGAGFCGDHENHNRRSCPTTLRIANYARRRMSVAQKASVFRSKPPRDVGGGSRGARPR